MGYVVTLFFEWQCLLNSCSDWDSPFHEESHYACPVYDGGEERPSMFSALDDQRKDGSPKAEDLEVRMDLTDDLLHMVYITIIIIC